ncbi:hypothetical protein A2U01_0087833, partial [Trifolium medium]|nr:hypothetical protein [Trifolium medium]
MRIVLDTLIVLDAYEDCARHLCGLLDAYEDCARHLCGLLDASPEQKPPQVVILEQESD